MRAGWLLMMGLARLACAAPAQTEPDVGVASEALTITYENPAPDAPPPDLASPTLLGRSATVASDRAERAWGVRIYQNQQPTGQLVYRVHLVDLQPGERLRIHGEVTLSRCNTNDIAGGSSDSIHSPCNSKPMFGMHAPATVNDDLAADPYPYAPRFLARVELVSADGSLRLPIASSDWMRCPQRRHHCALTVPEIPFDMLPPTGDVYIDLVVFADDANPTSGQRTARSYDPMEVEQQHGGLTVVRLAPGVPDPAMPAPNDHIVTKKIPIDRPGGGATPEYRRVVYHSQVGALGGGIVQARARAAIRLRPASRSTVNPLVTSQLLLTPDPTTVRAGANPGPDGALGTADDVWAHAITVRNGANCYDHSGGLCIYEDEGAIEIPGPSPSGQWWVVQVVGALRGDAPPGGKDFVRVRPLPPSQRDGLEVRVR